MRNPFAALAMATSLLGDGLDGWPIAPPRKNDDEFFGVRRANPEFEDLDFRKEAALIREKKSRLSANNRQFILRAVERADALERMKAQAFKEAEYAAFDHWLNAERPSGDSSLVQLKWEESNERAEWLEAYNDSLA